MNFSIGKYTVELADKFDKSPTLRRMYYAALCIGYLFAVSALVHAIRWW